MLTYPPSVRGRWPRQPAYPCRISLLPHARYPTIPHQPTRAGPLSRVTPILSHRGDTSATGPTALGHPLAEERQERVNWAVALRVWKEKDSPRKGVQLPKVSRTLLGAISHSAGTPFYRLAPEISGRDHPALCTNARLGKEHSQNRPSRRALSQARKNSSSVDMASERGGKRNVLGRQALVSVWQD